MFVFSHFRGSYCIIRYIVYIYCNCDSKYRARANKNVMMTRSKQYFHSALTDESVDVCTYMTNSADATAQCIDAQRKPYHNGSNMALLNVDKRHSLLHLADYRFKGAECKSKYRYRPGSSALTIGNI